jgi:hypothetical protein
MPNDIRVANTISFTKITICCYCNSIYLLQDLVDVDLVGFNGLCLLLAGTFGGLLHNLLGSRCLGCGSLDALLSDFGSHDCFGCVCMYEIIDLWIFNLSTFQ